MSILCSTGLPKPSSMSVSVSVNDYECVYACIHVLMCYEQVYACVFVSICMYMCHYCMLLPVQVHD